MADDLLAALGALAAEIGATAMAHEAAALDERVREGRFFVACLGQFKRGKSTLINALLGEEILPSGVVPVTSVVTVVRFGDRGARVRIGMEPWRSVPVGDLTEYASERCNPENRKGVTGIEVFCPSPLLRRGLCLVDTPGISSVFAGNTAETRSFVPHIDAAIVVLGGDPPISGDELTLVRSVAERVQNILFALNKSDRLSDTERHEAVAFTQTVLRDQVGIARPTIYEVSALEQLRRTGPARDWNDLVARLDELASRAGTELVAQAASRGVASLVTRLRRHLAEERAALLRPIEATEQRLERLRTCARDPHRAIVELRYLFDADQQNLARLFEDARVGFVADTMPAIVQDLDGRVASAPVRRGPGLRTYALAQAQEIIEARVRAWHERERGVAEREFARMTERFVGHANAFLERLAEAGPLSVDALPSKLAAETGLRARSHYFPTSLIALMSPPLWLWVVDWFRSAASMQVSARGAAIMFAKRLLEANANRVVGDVDDRITESRRGVEAALRRTLKETVTSAEQAAAKARVLQLAGADAVRDAVATLDAFSARLERLVDPARSGS